MPDPSRRHTLLRPVPYETVLKLHGRLCKMLGVLLEGGCLDEVLQLTASDDYHRFELTIKPTAAGDPSAPPPLTDTERAVLDVIKANPQGLTGAELARAVTRTGTPIAESTLTRHIIPRLRLHGVRNRPGAGYYLTD